MTRQLDLKKAGHLYTTLMDIGMDVYT
ncbi:MAG: hypothetical protein RL701_5813, partial [Pseudomonadota bacterium]